MDKFRAITLFCRAVEARSFAAAAHDLDIAPSVLSKAVAALEADLQLTLFHRSTRRLALTEAGASYYESCRQILAELEEAEALARRDVVQAQGTLRVGVHPAFRLALVQRLGEFLAVNPGVKIETVVTNLPTMLLDDGLDVVFAIGELPDSNFVVRRLGWTRWVTCASPSYLDAYGRPGHPRDLTGHRAIIPGRRDEESFARWSYDRGGEREVVDVPVALIVRDGIGLGDAAAGGAGVARIYDLSANAYLKAGALEAILSDWSSDRKPVYAVTASRRGIPAKVRLLLDFAQALLADGE